MVLTYEEMAIPNYDVMNDAAIDETWKYVAPLAMRIRGLGIMGLKSAIKPAQQIINNAEVISKFFDINNLFLFAKVFLLNLKEALDS